MRHYWLAFIGSCLLVVGCSKSGYVAAAPTQPPLPTINTTATQVQEGAVRSTATADMRSAVAETLKLVGMWAVTTAPTHTIAFGNFDDRTNIVTILVDPEYLKATTTYDVQVGETIPRDAWPQSLVDALAEQDPRVEVQLIPDTVIMTDTVAMSSTTTSTATLTQYRNANPYLPEPEFEVSYDPVLWSLDQTMESNDRLLHRTIENCDFRLQAGPMGAQSVAKTELAGREWTISLGQPNILLYWFSYKTIGFNFGLIMPTDYSPTEKNPCQVQAEQVIDTFRIIESEN